MIKVTFDATLTAEPRPGQLTNEGTNESTRRALENPKLHPTMRTYYERQLAEPRPRWGRNSDGDTYTMLRVDHEGRRFEISVVGDKFFDRVDHLRPGAKLRISCELTGEEPHLYLRLRQIAVVPEGAVA